MSPRTMAPANVVRCAIYTRKSTDEGLDNGFSSLDAQREAAEAFIQSQRGEGWTCLPARYDDGGFSGGTMDRPALRRLLAEIEAGRADAVVVYKVDRLSRSLLDFARIMEVLDRHGAAFVSITQQFATYTSIGRLTLNMLLSFAQFERELIAERTRDKMSAARKKGKWVGGMPMLGYDVAPKGGRLIVNEAEAVDDQPGCGSGWQVLGQGAPALFAQEPGVHREGRAPGHGLPRGARGDHVRRGVGADAGTVASQRQGRRRRGPEQAWGPPGRPALVRVVRGPDDSHLHAEGRAAVPVLPLPPGAEGGEGHMSDQGVHALEAVDAKWETLPPQERVRLVRLLVERVAYDGEKETVAITFRPDGIKTLARECVS